MGKAGLSLLVAAIGIGVLFSPLCWTEMVDPSMSEREVTVRAMEGLFLRLRIICLCLGRRPSLEEIRAKPHHDCRSGKTLFEKLEQSDGWGKPIALHDGQMGITAVSKGPDSGSGRYLDYNRIELLLTCSP